MKLIRKSVCVTGCRLYELFFSRALYQSSN